MANESKVEISTAAYLSIVFAFFMVIFGFLFFRERQKEPRVREIVREVPVEVIKEVEKERLVTVSKPAELTYAQKYHIDFAEKYFAAPMVASYDEVFYGIESFKIAIALDDVVKKVISEDRVKNKLELALRRNGISVDPDSDYNLNYTVSGLWNKDGIVLSYSYNLSVMETITFARNGDLRRYPVDVWQRSGTGYAGKNLAEKAMLDGVDEAGDDFSIRFLRVMDKEKR